MNRKSKVITVLIHVVVWIVILSLPLLLDYEDNIRSLKILIFGPTVPVLFAALIFYLNYFYIVKKYLFNKQYLLFVLANLLLLIICVIAMVQVRELLEFFDQKMNWIPDEPGHGPHHGEGLHRPPPNKDFFDIFMWKDIITMVLSTVICVTIKSIQKLSVTEAEKQKAEQKNIESSLQLLKYQLHPHFFFNSLNNIYSLIETAPQKARESLYNLSRLMRYSLNEKELVSMKDELDFIKMYYSLMLLRLRPDIKTRIEIPEKFPDLMLHPFLLIPLIENAFKHGVSSKDYSEISVKVSFEGNSLTLTTRNTNFPKKGSDESGSGIGLANLKKRLDLLYPGKHIYSSHVSEGYYFSTLMLEL